MRLEQIPVLLAALVGLLGIVLLGDALLSDRGGPPAGERRRRARAERDRLGEGIVGLGLLCMAAALAGRDTWLYGNVAVLAGTILLLAGAALNHRFIRELLLFRGPARRQPERAPRGAEVVRHRGDDGATPGTPGVPNAGTSSAAPPDPGETTSGESPSGARTSGEPPSGEPASPAPSARSPGGEEPPLRIR